MIGSRVGLVRCGLAAVALCLVFALQVRAQEPPPSVSDTADRPGFADSPVLLGRGHIQVESGLAWEHEGRPANLTKTLTWPQLELHAGLTPRLEVSLAWDGLVSSVSNPEGRTTGGADLRLGAKFGLVNRPSVDAALIGYVELPVGSGSVSSGYADPLARFAWGISVSDRVGLSGTADLGAAREADGRSPAETGGQRGPGDDRGGNAQRLHWHGCRVTDGRVDAQCVVGRGGSRPAGGWRLWQGGGGGPGTRKKKRGGRPPRDPSNTT